MSLSHQIDTVFMPPVKSCAGQLGGLSMLPGPVIHLVEVAWRSSKSNLFPQKGQLYPPQYSVVLLLFWCTPLFLSDAARVRPDED